MQSRPQSSGQLLDPATFPNTNDQPRSVDHPATAAQLAATQAALSGDYAQVAQALINLRNATQDSVWSTEFDMANLNPLTNNNSYIYAEMAREQDIHGVYVENLSNIAVQVFLGQGTLGRFIGGVKSSFFKTLLVPDGIKIVTFAPPAGTAFPGPAGLVRISICNKILPPTQGAAN